MNAARWVTALLGGGTLVVVVSLSDAATLAVMAPGVLQRMLPALLVNGGAATVVFLEGAVTRSGAVAGAALGTTIYLGAGWEGWAMLAAMFVAAFMASNVGLTRKRMLGIAQEAGGQRGARHALANCGVAAAAAIVAITSPYQAAAWLALSTALVAAGADTVASEIGKAWGRRTILIVNLRPVSPGTSGAISLEGSLANVVAAFALAALGAAVGLLGARSIPLVAAGAVLGSLLESVLGATLEPIGIVNNEHLNFINAASAASVVVCLS